MYENFPPWLTKQMMRNINNSNLNAYLVALEGWRRGLSLTWYLESSRINDLKTIGWDPNGKLFSLSTEETTRFFHGSRGDKVTNGAVDAATNKLVMGEKLTDAGIPLPKRKEFNSEALVEDIVSYGTSLKFPLVVKQTFESSKRNNTKYITTAEQLKEHINYIYEVGYKKLIVERYVEGDNYRVYVIGDKVVGAINRMPANVVGDGHSNIRQLIEMKNKQRKENPYLRSKLIKIDKDLEKVIHNENLSLESVPVKEQRIFLRKITSMTAGGDSIEAMDMLKQEVKDLAIRAVKAIPGLKHAGVDLFVSQQDCIVCNIEPDADISIHVFPYNGRPSNIPEKLIDYYFPTIKENIKASTKLYFDYTNILELLKKRIIQEYTVPNAPLGKFYCRRYVVSGHVQNVGYRSWIRREAMKQGLHGYAKNIRNGNVEVIVGGNDELKVNTFRESCAKGSRHAMVVKVKEYVWEKQIKVGFELRTDKRVKAGTKNVNDRSRSGSVSFTAVGDILLHGRVYGGLRKKSNFKFTEQLSNVKSILGKTDITMANLETIIAGKEIGLSAFPRFNGPVEIGYALKDMGVDIVTIANNHVLDRGEKGLLRSIDNIERIGLEYDGAFKSVEDRDRLRIITRNGLRVGFISYTRGTNGIKIPKDKSYLVNSLQQTSTLRIAKELRRIKRENIADVIIVNLHFGEEYHLTPSDDQKKLAASLSDAGADVIVGHHPHVLQPPEWIENSQGMKTFVAYSLGNFFSGQNGLHRQIGAALSLDINKPSKNRKGIIIENPKYELTFTNRTSRMRYDIHLFREWIEKNKYIKTNYGIFNSEEIYKETKKRLRKKINYLNVI